MVDAKDGLDCARVPFGFVSIFSTGSIFEDAVAKQPLNVATLVTMALVGILWCTAVVVGRRGLTVLCGYVAIATVTFVRSFAPLTEWVDECRIPRGLLVAVAWVPP